MSAKAGKRWPAASGEAIEPERLLPQLHAADPEDEATQAVLLISGMGPAYSTERRTASPRMATGTQSAHTCGLHTPTAGSSRTPMMITINWLEAVEPYGEREVAQSPGHAAAAARAPKNLHPCHLSHIIRPLHMSFTLGTREGPETTAIGSGGPAYARGELVRSGGIGAERRRAGAHGTPRP